VNIIESGRWRRGERKTLQDAKQDEQKTRTVRMLQADKRAKLADETGEELKKEHKSIKREGLLLQIGSNEKKETNFQMLKAY
jgi:hypothetical protein